MTGLFGKESPFVDRLLIEGKCVLVFEEYSQKYSLPCRIRRLEKSEPAHSATMWHNRVFNPMLGDNVQVIAFQPDWDEAVEMIGR